MAYLGTIDLAFDTPSLLALIPVAWILVVWMEWRIRGTPLRQIVRVLSRGLLLSLGIAAMAGPHAHRTASTEPRFVVALDRAVLRGPAGLREAQAWLDRARKEADLRSLPTDVVSFDVEALAPVPIADSPRMTPQSSGERSRLLAGLSAARLAFDGDRGGRVVVLTNGRAHEQGVDRELARMNEQGIDVVGVSIPNAVETTPPKVGTVRSFDPPRRVAGPVAARAVVASDSPSVATLFIDGVEFKSVSVQANANDQEVDFGRISLAPGHHRLNVRLIGCDETCIDEIERRVYAEGRPTTLVMHTNPVASPFVRAWRAYGASFEVLGPGQSEQLHRRLAPENRPSRPLLLADAASLAALSAADTQALRAALQRGLGLVVEGGSHADAWDLLSKAPAASLLPQRPVAEPPPPPKPDPNPPPAEPSRPLDPPDPDKGPGLRAERQPEEARPITVLLLIDRSGSMDGEKFSMALEGARRTAAALSPWDRLGVITFARKARVDLRPRSIKSQGTRSLWAAGLSADGDATDIFGALRRAGELLAEPDNATPIQHVILLTDGAQTVGAPIFSPVVRPLGARGVTITAVGIGRGARLRDLREIVHWAAGGSVVAARTAAEIPTILTRDTSVLAKRRSNEARAMARIRDAERERNRPKEPPPPTKQSEPPLPSKEPPTPPVDDASDASSERAPLQVLQRHEALLGIDHDALPDVARPFKSESVPDGIALLQSGERIALSARREGLGRVLLWSVRSEDPGTRGWKQWGVFLQQLARAARAPAGSFDAAPTLRVRQYPEASYLDVSWPPGISQGKVTVTWVGPGERRKVLATVSATREAMRVALPDLAPGLTARIEATGEAGVSIPSVNYRRRREPPVAERAGDATRVNALFGSSPEDVGTLFDTLSQGTTPDPRPMWAILVISMIALLPLDVALHRRSVRR